MNLQQELKALNGSAGKAVEDSEKVSTELSRSISWWRRSNVKQQVRSQQEAEVTPSISGEAGTDHWAEEERHLAGAALTHSECSRPKK